MMYFYLNGEAVDGLEPRVCCCSVAALMEEIKDWSYDKK